MTLADSIMSPTANTARVSPASSPLFGGRASSTQVTPTQGLVANYFSRPDVFEQNGRLQSPLARNGNYAEVRFAQQRASGSQSSISAISNSRANQTQQSQQSSSNLQNASDASTLQQAQGDEENAEGITTGSNSLTPKEEELVSRLQDIDRNVRTHEQAHMAAGGDLVRGLAYEYMTAPDGKRYAVAGEVRIDTAAADTPEETVQKMQRVRRAALAPSDPSPQDLSVASRASSIENQARSQVFQQRAQNSSRPSAEQQRVQIESRTEQVQRGIPNTPADVSPATQADFNSSAMSPTETLNLPAQLSSSETPRMQAMGAQAVALSSSDFGPLPVALSSSDFGPLPVALTSSETPRMQAMGAQAVALSSPEFGPLPVALSSPDNGAKVAFMQNQVSQTYGAQAVESSLFMRTGADGMVINGVH